MFLERCGKFFFSKVRLALFFALLLIPIISASLFLLLQFMELKEMEDRFQTTSLKESVALQRKARKEAFLNRYSQFNPYFLNQKIEALQFLKEEKEYLELLTQKGLIPRNDQIQERLHFLSSPENRLSFIEENIRTSPKIKETDEKQKHPVQMNEEDLAELLSLLEDIQIGPYLPSLQSPQFLIRNFHLKKTISSLQTPVFEVELELLKREFNKK
jgi:hypothetical protein